MGGRGRPWLPPPPTTAYLVRSIVRSGTANQIRHLCGSSSEGDYLEAATSNARASEAVNLAAA